MKDKAELARWSSVFTTFFVVDSLFLIILIVETAMRYRAAKTPRAFIGSVGNICDLLVMLSSTVSVLSLAMEASSRISSLCAAFWCIRIFRFLRLAHWVPELAVLSYATSSAGRLFFWSVVLLVTVVYAVALPCTILIGYAPSLSDDEQTQDYFGSISASMFTLFTFVTLEDWPSVTRHLMQRDILGPIVGIFTVAFILLTHIALLGFITGVFQQTVSKTATELSSRNMNKLMRERTNTAKTLSRLFDSIDKDGNGTVSLQELMTAVTETDEASQMLSDLRISLLEVEEFYHLIDFDGDGVLTKAELIEGFRCLKEGNATAKQVLALQHDMHNMWHSLQRRTQALEGCVTESHKLMISDRKQTKDTTKDTTASTTEQLVRDLATKMEEKLAALQKSFHESCKQMERTCKECSASAVEATSAMAASVEQRQSLLTEVDKELKELRARAAAETRRCQPAPFASEPNDRGDMKSTEPPAPNGPQVKATEHNRNQERASSGNEPTMNQESALAQDERYSAQVSAMHPEPLRATPVAGLASERSAAIAASNEGVGKKETVGARDDALSRPGAASARAQALALDAIKLETDIHKVSVTESGQLARLAAQAQGHFAEGPMMLAPEKAFEYYELEAPRLQHLPDRLLQQSRLREDLARPSNCMSRAGSGDLEYPYAAPIMEQGHSGRGAPFHREPKLGSMPYAQDPASLYHLSPAKLDFLATMMEASQQLTVPASSAQWTGGTMPVPQDQLHFHLNQLGLQLGLADQLELQQALQ
eukprot:gnl/TRDRNA2_/TRDRNA2_31285_c0_seq1.p1 gnl/TRDRNA2_/TRDRNA2_31285_c0~~gnl/TRDRNA2_/TRDRNA2_31285_c0_seq1.p1  ORF type:complete len:863 (-),score=131.90 gnl/TRDRNA2_/TRDRNA2_31285_c0_seq1:70-2370(-)